MHPAFVSCSTLRLSTIRPTPSSSFISRRPRFHTPAASPPYRPISSPFKMSATEPPTQPTAKELAQLYGGSYLATSIGMSIVSFAALYFLIRAGVDMRVVTHALGDFLAATPLGRPKGIDNIPDEASAAALAYIVHKASSPLRFPLTIAATPFVANLFKKSYRLAANGVCVHMYSQYWGNNIKISHSLQPSSWKYHCRTFQACIVSIR